jgi:hypothetical protein
MTEEEAWKKLKIDLCFWALFITVGPTVALIFFVWCAVLIRLGLHIIKAMGFPV